MKFECEVYCTSCSVSNGNIWYETAYKATLVQRKYNTNCFYFEELANVMIDKLTNPLVPGKKYKIILEDIT